MSSRVRKKSLVLNIDSSGAYLLQISFFIPFEMCLLLLRMLCMFSRLSYKSPAKSIVTF